MSECALCGRDRPLTFHHLIPKKIHSRRYCRVRFDRAARQAGIRICPDCHDAVHRFESEKELGLNFNTVEKLLAHPEIGKFVRWVAERDIGRVRVRRPQRRRR